MTMQEKKEKVPAKRKAPSSKANGHAKYACPFVPFDTSPNFALTDGLAKGEFRMEPTTNRQAKGTMMWKWRMRPQLSPESLGRMTYQTTMQSQN